MSSIEALAARVDTAAAKLADAVRDYRETARAESKRVRAACSCADKEARESGYREVTFLANHDRHLLDAFRSHKPLALVIGKNPVKAKTLASRHSAFATREG